MSKKLERELENKNQQTKELENENRILKEKIKILHNKLHYKDFRLKPFTQIPYGFSISQKEKGGGVYMYAQKRIDGKMHGIYIGNVQHVTEELLKAKIEVWLAKNYPELLSID